MPDPKLQAFFAAHEEMIGRGDAAGLAAQFDFPILLELPGREGWQAVERPEQLLPVIENKAAYIRMTGATSYDLEIQDVSPGEVDGQQDVSVRCSRTDRSGRRHVTVRATYSVRMDGVDPVIQRIRYNEIDAPLYAAAFESPAAQGLPLDS